MWRFFQKQDALTLPTFDTQITFALGQNHIPSNVRKIIPEEDYEKKISEVE